jgi:hypothetical protein
MAHIFNRTQKTTNITLQHPTHIIECFGKTLKMRIKQTSGGFHENEEIVYSFCHRDLNGRRGVSRERPAMDQPR